MPPQPAGPDPPAWTCADVERWLITAFRAMPMTAIYAPRGNTLTTIGSDVPSATFDIVAFTVTVLGRKSDECKAVLIWARTKATRGEVGGSVAEFCVKAGWSRSTFEDRRRRACERVAEAKNRADAAATSGNGD